MSVDAAAIVPAAGLGRRFARSDNKLFALLNGEPLLSHTLRALQRSASISWIALVVHPLMLKKASALLEKYGITKALEPCIGGSSRYESVRRGFRIIPKQARWVLVHDGARPCVSAKLIEDALRLARRYGAVICGLPAGLTVKAVDKDGRVRLTLDREQLFLAQTPQIFRRDWFAESLAHVNSHANGFPDDAAILEHAGFPVRMIQGDPLNIKVTTQEDLFLAEAVLKQRNQG